MKCHPMIRDHLSWCHKVTKISARPPCIFGDILKCLPAGSFDPASSFASRLLDINRAKFMQKQYCFMCQRDCPLFGPTAASDFEVGGLPCTDASAAGQRKFHEGSTSSVFLAHAKRHAEMKTPLMVLENAQDWDSDASNHQFVTAGQSTNWTQGFFPPNQWKSKSTSKTNYQLILE